MQVASIRLMMDDKGSDIPMTGVTPAEAVILALDHVKNVSRYPITDVVIAEGDGDQRSVLDEVRRLRAKYGKARVNETFPGALPLLPSSFDEAREIVSSTVGDDEAEGPSDSEPGVLFGSKDDAEAAIKAASVETTDN